MAAQQLPLANLTEQSRNFTTIATLIKKHPAKKSREGTTNLQQLIFEDAQGTQMKVVIFERDIELFNNLLIEDREYKITNCIITRIPDMYVRDNQLYQMTINSATRISDTRQRPEPSSLLVLLNRALDFVGTSNRIDIIGIAIHIYDVETIRSKTSGLPNEVRRIKIIDSNMKPVTLSAWTTLVHNEAANVDDIIDTMPVIEVSRVKASTFDEGSFNTTFASSLKINPTTLEAQLLRDWTVNNKDQIRILQNSLVTRTTECSQQPELIIPISQLPEQESGKTVRIIGRVTDITNKNSIVYNACNVCSKRCETERGLVFNCRAFSSPHVGTSKPRTVLHITFADDSGDIPITLFGHLAEQLINDDANHMATLTLQEQRSLVDSCITAFKDRELTIEMTTYMLGEGFQQLRWKAKRIIEA
ncbi:replication protein A 70 kDa DNA-binding subunit B-like [Chenopodium quinoa]|nr:replication protein A 70 kDa DNA-binding subunit B-like [Chenopodium quinoa]